MRQVALFILLLACGPADAGTVLLSSDPQRHGSLAAIPEVVFAELQKGGARPQGEGKGGASGLQSLQVRKLDCRTRRDASGKEEASCKFDDDEGGGHLRSQRYEAAQALTDALRELSDAADSLDMVECDSNDDCRIRVRSILCMVNDHLKAGTPGRANCSFSD